MVFVVILFVVTKFIKTFDQHKEGGNKLMVIAGKENGEKKQLRQKERNNIIKQSL